MSSRAGGIVRIGRPHRSRGLIALAVAAIALAISAATASAATTRADYVAQVDPICQAGTSKEGAVTRSIKKRAKRLREKGIDTDELTKPVIRLAVRYSNGIVAIERGENDQISLVMPAPGDEATVSQWLQLRAQATDTFQHAFHVLTHKKVKRYKQLLGRSFRIGVQSQELVRDYGFKHCAQVQPDT